MEHATRAPNAHVYVLEYPQLVQPPLPAIPASSLPDVFTGSDLLSLSYNEQKAIVDVVKN